MHRLFALVVAAILAAFGLTTHSRETHAQFEPTARPETTRMASKWISVAAGFGSLWAINARDQLLRVSPTTGDVQHFVQLPDAPLDVFVSRSLVWIEGGSGKGYYVSAYNPTSSRLFTWSSSDFNATLGPATTQADSLWLLVGGFEADYAAHFELEHGKVIRTTVKYPTNHVANSIATTANGQVWVTYVDHHVAQLTKSHFAKPRLLTWNHDLFGPARVPSYPKNTVWSTDGQRLIQLQPQGLQEGDSSAMLARLRTFGEPEFVAQDEVGAFVVTKKEIDFFSTHELADGYQPTERFKDPALAKKHDRVLAVAAIGRLCFVVNADGSVLRVRIG